MSAKNTNFRVENIFTLIDKNHFSLSIDENPSRDKIERIKEAIKRKEQLFNQTIKNYAI